MKYLALLMFIVSCGKYESGSGTRLGQRVKFEPQELTKAELEMKERLCAAIDAKTKKLSVMNGAGFTFNISETSCAGESSQSESVEVKVEVSDSYIHFVRDNGNFFIFKDAETLRSGVFKSYCNSNQTPFMHNGNPVWMDTKVSEHCSLSSQSLCVNFKSGLKELNTENSYQLVTQDTFKIDTFRTSEKYGFYTQRVLESSASCDSGTHLIKATLN